MRRCNEWITGFFCCYITSGNGLSLTYGADISIPRDLLVPNVYAEFRSCDYAEQLRLSLIYLEYQRRQLGMSCHKYIQDAWTINVRWNNDFSKWRYVG